jgi:hypothetical protein
MICQRFFRSQELSKFETISQIFGSDAHFLHGIKILAHRPFFASSKPTGPDVATWEEAYSNLAWADSGLNCDPPSRQVNDVPSVMKPNGYSPLHRLEDPWIMDPNFVISQTFSSQFLKYSTVPENRAPVVAPSYMYSSSSKELDLFRQQRTELFNSQMKSSFREIYIEFDVSLKLSHCLPKIHLRMLKNTGTDLKFIFSSFSEAFTILYSFAGQVFESMIISKPAKEQGIENSLTQF